MNDDDSGLFVQKYLYDTSDLEKELSIYPYISRLPIIVYGKQCYQNRDVCFFSNDTEGYFYSGQFLSSNPLTSSLEEVLEKVNEITSLNFNAILINRYNSGNDYIGAHSDNESSLVSGTYRGYEGKIVASLSSGATRKFRIRNKYTKEKIFDIPLENKDLCLMVGKFQSKFTHEIPKETRVKDTRYSLTFRHHE